mgnify:FL=1
MANVINLEQLKAARALLDSALAENPDVLNRLTLQDIEMAYQSEQDTMVISVRMDRRLVERLDQYTRELAVKEKRRITRNMMFNELTELALNVLENKEERP